jgi:DNA repair exonuclease SbcCD ATPase subunit
MNLVLAVEPDAGQAALLRRLVSRVDGVELILVNSAEAVPATLTSRVPRLLLLGASLDEQSRALAVDHYILASDSSDPPVLPIPRLPKADTTAKGKTRRKSKAGGSDVDVFTAALARCLADGGQQSSEPADELEAGEEVFLELDSLAEVEPSIGPAAHAAAMASMQQRADARLTDEVGRVRREADERHAADIARVRAEAEARLEAEVSRLEAEVAEARVRLETEVAEVRARVADEARNTEAAAIEQAISRVRAEAAEQLAAQLAEADRLRSAAEERALAEVERIKSGSAEHLEMQLRRAQKETAAAVARAEAADAARAQAAAVAEALRAETEAKHAAAIARATGEIEAALTLATGEVEAARQLQQAAERDAESARLALSDARTEHHAALEQARGEAERDSRTQGQEANARHQAELARAHDELNRVRQEMERVQAAHHAAVAQARADAERDSREQAARAESARVESESGLRAELERATRQLNDVRQEMERVQAAHHSAVAQARAEAERDSRTHADEVVRAEAARAEAESRLRAELEHAHQELTRARQEIEQARTAHQSAIAQIRADAERDSRERAAEALRTETARIDAEGRHREALAHAQQELKRVREEMEHIQVAHRSALEQTRADAEREIRAWAETEISTTAARLAADADARIAAAAAAARTEAEERRVAGLVALRAQLDELTGNTLDQLTRNAATPAAVETVAPPRETETETEFEPDAEPERKVTPIAAAKLRQAALLAVRGGRIAAHGLRVGGQVALPAARRVIRRLPGREATAAMILLAVGGLMFVDVSALTQRGTSAAWSASQKAASLLGITAADATEATNETEAPGNTTTETTAVAEPAAAPASSGLLQVNSRLPLDLYLAGKRIGRTGDREIALPPGRHRIEFVSERLNYRGEATISIRSSAFTTHDVTLPLGSLVIDTEPGAEIIIEGQSAGVAPLGVVGAPLGTSEVVVRHPERGERREVVEVRHGVTTELRVAFPPAADPQVVDTVPPA